MTSAWARNWKGRTLEERSAERRNRLVEAAVELLGTAGASAVTLRAVCGAAGLSLRFFYESFTNSDELILAAYDVTLMRMRDAVESASAASDDVRDQIHARLEAAVDLVETDPRVGRILFREPFARDALRVRAIGAIPEFFGDLVGPVWRDSGENSDLRISALGGAMVNLFLNWTEGVLGSDRVRFVDHCTEVTLRLLR
jgi:AcrR family transcriptional regulator